MNITGLTRLLAATFLLTASAQASAAMIVDTINADSDTTLVDPNYFLPNPGSDGNEFDDPYYRYFDMDLSTNEIETGNWGWKHNPIGGVITSASLSIRAFSVDYPDGIPGFDPGQHVIQGAVDSSPANYQDVVSSPDSSASTLLGDSPFSYSTTTFNLDSSWFDEIAGGLMVQLLIDFLEDGRYGVSLDYSELKVTVMDPPNPVPLPAALWLFATAILGLAGFGRRKSKT